MNKKRALLEFSLTVGYTQLKYIFINILLDLTTFSLEEVTWNILSHFELPLSFSQILLKSWTISHTSLKSYNSYNAIFIMIGTFRGETNRILNFSEAILRRLRSALIRAYFCMISLLKVLLFIEYNFRRYPVSNPFRSIIDY